MSTDPLQFPEVDFNLGTFAEQLERVRPPIAAAATLPPVSYTSDYVFALERERLFSRFWVGLGRADRWQRRGDYVAMDIVGSPVFVIRDREGNLRAFANTCSHRGARLLDGTGRCLGVRCPFHAWTYDLDGNLLQAPTMDKSSTFDFSDHSLHEYPIRTLAGFAFICLHDEPPEFTRWLGDFDARHAPWRLATLRTTLRREFTVACNWKLFLEVFNDYYHLPFVHSETLGALYDQPDPADVVSGQYTTQFGTTDGTGGLLKSTQDNRLPAMEGLQDRERHGTRYTWIYPNLTFAASTEAVWVLEAYPTSADESLVAISACFPEATIESDSFAERANYYYERFEETMNEDVAALANQQAGLASPRARQGRFSERLEPSVANFAFWYADQLRGAVGKS